MMLDMIKCDVTSSRDISTKGRDAAAQHDTYLRIYLCLFVILNLDGKHRIRNLDSG